MKRFFITIITMAVLMTPCLLSADNTNDDYVTLKAGWFWPNSSSNGLKDFKQAPAYEFNYGRMFGKNFAAELGGMYYSTKYNGDASIQNIPGDSSIDATATFYGPLATLKGIINPAEKLDLFVGAGAGYYWGEIELKSDDADNLKAKGKGVGWHITAGGSYKVIKRLALGIDGKYFQAKLDSNDFNEKTDFGGITASIYLKYLF